MLEVSEPSRYSFTLQDCSWLSSTATISWCRAGKQNLTWLDGLIEQTFQAKRMPRVGNPSLGRCERGHFLKKMICWTADGFSIRHHVKHVEHLIEQVLGRKL